MAPGMYKKKNPSSIQTNLQREHASSLLMRNSIQDAPTIMPMNSKSGGKKNLSGVYSKGVSSSRTHALLKSYKAVVNEMNLGANRTGNTQAPTSLIPTTHVPTPPNVESHHLESATTTPAANKDSNLSATVETETMDAQNENSDNTVIRKPVRGSTRGLGLYKRNLREKKKVKLNFTNLGDIAVEDKLWKHFAKIVKGKRARFHKLFKNCDNVTIAKSNIPSNLTSDMWNSLCDHWNNDRVKEICAKNKQNRALVSKPHNQGPVAFIPLYHELKKKYGADYNLIKFWKETRTSKSGIWTCVECEVVYHKMLQLVDESQETENPIDPDAAFHEVLGYKSGYCRGLGYGPTPPSSRRSDLESENAQLRELNNRLTEENLQLKEKCVVLTENVNELKERQAASDARQAASEAKQAATDARQAVFEKFMQDMMAKGQGDLQN